MKLIILLTALTLLVGLSAHAQVSLIANQDVNASSVSVSKAKDLYSLSSSDLNGMKVKLFDFQADNSAKKQFYDALDLSQVSLRKIWLKAKLTGNGTPPEMTGTEEEMISKIESTPGAVGYVSSSKVKGNVKVLLKID